MVKNYARLRLIREMNDMMDTKYLSLSMHCSEYDTLILADSHNLVHRRLRHALSVHQQSYFTFQ